MHTDDTKAIAAIRTFLTAREWATDAGYDNRLQTVDEREALLGLKAIVEASGEQAESLDSLDRIIMADLTDDERVTVVAELKHEVSRGRGGRAFHEDSVPALVKAGVVLKGDGHIELTARGLRIARKLAA